MDFIPGWGYDNADLMLVGDYARRNDFDKKQCLSGYYSRKCSSFLKEVNYSIDQCYQTCVLKTYIMGLGLGTWGADKKILEEFFTDGTVREEDYLKELAEEINIIKPTVIVAMGEYSLRRLTGKEGIHKWRGSVLPLDPSWLGKVVNHNIKVVATLHPSDIHTDESYEYLLRLDFKKAVDLIFNPEKKIDYHEITIARGSMDVLNFLNYYPEEPPEMSVDIETHYGFVTCAGISFDGYRGLCIPMYGARLDMLERCRMMYLLNEKLRNPKIGKVNQNIAYDKRIIQRFGFTLDPVIWDTMLAAHTIAPEFPKRLDFLTSVYTDMSFYKDEGHTFDPRHQSFDVLYAYNAKDAISAYQIYKKQIEELKEMGMYEFFIEFVMPLFDVYYRMESTGIKIDSNRRDDLIAKYEALYELKYLELRAIAEIEININSPSQIGKFLEIYNFPVTRHRVNSGYMAINTDAETLKKMKTMEDSEYFKCKLPVEHAKRFISLILILRRIDKILEHINVGIHPWGRVHTNIKIGGTGSGRTSNGQTSDGIPIWVFEKNKLGLKFKQLGQSFQTVTKHGFIVEDDEDIEDIEEGIIGKDIREMYIPDDGMVFVEWDLSHAEACVVDVLSEDWDGLAEYGKIDKHCKVASYIFTDYSYDEILKLAKKEKTKEGEWMRFMGKKGKHAGNYDMGDFRLANMANISRSEARTVLNRIHTAYPNLRKVFHAQVEETLRTTRCLWNSYGRKRMWYKKIEPHYIKVAYSWIPQSTVSDHLKGAMLRIDKRIDRTKAWLIVENHDSITALVKRGYIKPYCFIVKEELEKPIDFNKCVLKRDYQLVIPAECSIGRKNWEKMKDLKLKRLRPLGLEL